MPPKSRNLTSLFSGRLLPSSQPQSRSPRTICAQRRHECIRSIQTPSTPLHASLGQSRLFSSSRLLSKKSSASPKSSRKSTFVSAPKNKGEHIPDNMATKGRDSEIDPYDFTDLNDGIAKAIARLKDALVRTRDAGRVTPEMIEALPVELNVKGHNTQGGPAHKETTTIAHLASVVQKGGRQAQIFCAEEAHLKPISSAVQASSYSLVPQPDPNNPLAILIAVPPATAETRAQAKVEAKKVFERATQEIRHARGDAQKRHRKMEQQKLVIVDELHKAHKMMEDVVKRGQDEAKKVFDAAVKALDG